MNGLARDGTSRENLYLIMSNVSDLVDMLVPPNEFGETDMTPEILNQITAIQDAVCDALDLPRRPTIHLTTHNKFRHVTRPDNSIFDHRSLRFLPVAFLPIPISLIGACFPSFEVVMKTLLNSRSIG